jgi:hypothetical protein
VPRGCAAVLARVVAGLIAVWSQPGGAGNLANDLIW